MTQQTRSTDVRVTVTVDAPIERAFRVFTERFDAWWPRSYRLQEGELEGVVLEPREGGRWYERTTDGKECDWGRVLVWDPPRHVALAWMIGVGFVPNADPALASRVDVTFVENDVGRTTVTLVHSGFDRHGAGWESVRESVANEKGGWPWILDGYARVAGGAH